MRRRSDAASVLTRVVGGGCGAGATAIVLAGVLLPIAVVPVLGQGVPQVVHYQGYLQTNGEPYTGSVQIQFSIYDAQTGGTALWSETRQVSVSNGYYGELLGSVTPFGAEAFAGGERYLGIRVGTEDEMAPRLRIGSVGFAINADMVDGQNAEAFAAAASLRTSDGDPPNQGSSLVHWDNLTGVPAGFADGADDVATQGGGITEIEAGLGIVVTNPTGPTVTVGADIGTGATQVAAGDHAHAGVYVGSIGPQGMYGNDAQAILTASNAGSGSGVKGQTQGVQGVGVHGESMGTEGVGVYGEATATEGSTIGVYGVSRSSSDLASAGVLGESTATSGAVAGVWGEILSTSWSAGVYGHAAATVGLPIGVSGRSEAADGMGVYGLAAATSGLATGVAGQTRSPDGFGLYSIGNFAASGSKSCVVRTSSGPRLLYCQESPENWFEDFGEAHLVEGRAHVELDPLFLETVTVNDANPLKVFVQLLDECVGTRVVRGTTGFDVVELDGGRSSAAFMYRVVARRKGYEKKRLDYAAVGERDSFLFPEVREASSPTGLQR